MQKFKLLPLTACLLLAGCKTDGHSETFHDSEVYPQFAASIPEDSALLTHNELFTTPAGEVPEAVRVTHLLDTHGRERVDALAFILESIPSSWKTMGTGAGLSVSSDYSRAGEKSVRWDWDSGDVIRIPDLGALSSAKFTFNIANSRSEYSAPFDLSIFQEKPLPENTEFKIFLKRWDTVSNTSELVQLTYKMNFGGSWANMGLSFVPDFRAVFEGGYVLEHINSMPEGVPEPQDNELVLLAPTDVASGTFYLDRLIVPATEPTRDVVDGGLGINLPHSWNDDTQMINHDAMPAWAAPPSQYDIVTVGVPVRPIDPTTITPVSPAIYGYFAEKPDLPGHLDGEQKAFIDQARADFFEPRRPNPPEARRCQEYEQNALEILEREATKQPDGSYKIKESINFGNGDMFFEGDLYSQGRWHQLPTPIRDEPNWKELYEDANLGRDYAGWEVNRRFSNYGQWFGECPDNKPIENLLKAQLDWMKYQVVNPPLGGAGFTGAASKAGGEFIREAQRVIATMRDRGKPADAPYIKYMGDVASWVGRAHSAAFSVSPTPGTSTEWNGRTMYDSMLFEADDREQFRLLKGLRRNFNGLMSISEYRNVGMIKPDYSYYHHGIVSYWGGNYFVHMDSADVFRDTLLDLDPVVRRNLAWYTTRYTFGGLKAASRINGDRGYPRFPMDFEWGLKNNDDRLKPIGEPTPFDINEWPRRSVFDYFYEMDWEEIPSAKKYLSGVMGMAVNLQPKALNKLICEYPKLAGLEPQPNMHISMNWSPTSVFNAGLSQVHVGAYNDKQSNPAPAAGYWGWIMGYGGLTISENDRVGKPGNFRPALGHTANGYSWSKVPGATIPAVTDEEYEYYHGGRGNNNPNSVDLAATGGAGNGSLTFNETEESFGKYGNFSFQTKLEENSHIWKLFKGVNSGVEGKKSYHFFEDKVVAIGSDYYANTRRPMETILFQEGTNKAIDWLNKNPQRWNPESLTLNLNGEHHDKAFFADVPSEQSNYIVSPFGHAYVVPAGQDSRFKVEWKSRTTLLNWEQYWGSQNPGTEMRTGETAIAWLDHGPSNKGGAGYHYTVLLNADGKNGEQMEAFAKSVQLDPGYEVLSDSGAAHAVRFDGVDGEKDVYSYVVYEGNKALGLPYIASTSKRVNLMMQENAQGELVITVTDPFIDIDRDNNSPNFDLSRDRNITVTFDRPVRGLVEARSGLPQTNPALNPRLSGNTLTFTTRNGVNDTFTLRL